MTPAPKKEAQNNQLSSSLMAALPLPVLLPKAENSNNNNDTVPPPPAPMLRPLPAPTGKFRGLSGPTEIIKSSVQSVVVRDSISVRSSSICSNSSTTSLETAAASVDMETFKELLLDGFEAVKHGRRGRPHPDSSSQTWTSSEYSGRRPWALQIEWAKANTRDSSRASYSGTSFR